MRYNKKFATRLAVMAMVAITGAGAAMIQGPSALGTVTAERSACC